MSSRGMKVLRAGSGVGSPQANGRVPVLGPFRPECASHPIRLRVGDATVWTWPRGRGDASVTREKPPRAGGAEGRPFRKW
ncbi:hypothetical protein GCM10009530_53270 [Microbispora corallina]|uniref:Uncharacterized protein n=1 Tax=Microbispora corallina TaxID=83302 RepID=A0ABQ4G4K3_9ACTN|nr:hypothetical protein Mco01_49690 [Microbispora corallina]